MNQCSQAASLAHKYLNCFQDYMDNIHPSCKHYDIKINTAKTDIMKDRRISSLLNLYIEDNNIQHMKEFMYGNLGCMFTKDGKFDKEIDVGTQRAKPAILAAYATSHTPRSQILRHTILCIFKCNSHVILFSIFRQRS